jgi:hypothetical protein
MENCQCGGTPGVHPWSLFLFLLFINDIKNEVLNNIKMFADDTSLYCVVEDQTSAAESLNEDLAFIHRWSSDWEIMFNATKTKSMLFSREKMANLPLLFFNGTMLENSKSHKHLGVTFNSNGKWNNHINEIYTKACRRINILRLMKHKLDRKSLEKLCIGFIRPILEYEGIVWDNCSLHESELLESVQLEAARIITGLRKGTSHAKLYTELGWVPLKECRRTNKLILLHKILHDETPLYLLNEILLQANHQSSYNLRFKRVFEPPFCNTTSYKCRIYLM